MSEMIVEQSYWDRTYRDFHLERVPATDATRQVIRKFLPVANAGQTAFEFGCFPGRYLVELGELGYEVSGCDLTPRVDTELAPWIKGHNVAVGAIHRCDYRDIPERKFDVVASFGFVEHFDNYQDIFRHHFRYVKPGGTVIVTFPNFRGVVQRGLRLFLDRENLDRHVVASMNLPEYISLAREYGEVVFCGHYGNFDFWVEPPSRPHNRIQRKALGAIMKSRRLWRHFPTAGAWSPFGGIIIQASN